MKLIKNAGAIVTHPFGGIMRSVIVALFELKANEIFIIGHHDCGMGKINPEGTLGKMVELGIEPSTISTLEYAGINIARWLHGFDSVQESVESSVRIIRNHPLVPAHVAVHGLIIDPETGASPALNNATPCARLSYAALWPRPLFPLIECRLPPLPSAPLQTSTAQASWT